jgi:hypothetical protein
MVTSPSLQGTFPSALQWWYWMVDSGRRLQIRAAANKSSDEPFRKGETQTSNSYADSHGYTDTICKQLLSLVGSCKIHTYNPYVSPPRLSGIIESSTVCTTSPHTSQWYHKPVSLQQTLMLVAIALLHVFLRAVVCWRSIPG